MHSIYRGAPPVRWILLSIANQRCENLILGGADTPDGSIQGEDDHFHAGGPKVNAKKGTHEKVWGLGVGSSGFGVGGSGFGVGQACDACWVSSMVGSWSTGKFTEFAMKQSS